MAEYKNLKEQQERAPFAYFLIVLMLFVLVIRLATLQLFQKEEFSRLSEENRIRLVPIQAPRGIIRDRNGVILADNYPSYTISIIPYQLPPKETEETIRRLSRLLNIPTPEIEQKLKSPKTHAFSPVRITQNVTMQTVTMVEEHVLELPGVVVQVEPRRRYPFGTLGAHVLGYLGEITREELAKLRSQGYGYGDMIGRYGLERQYEPWLRGKDGLEFEEVTARGQRLGRVENRPTIEPQPGADLTLTLDYTVQHAMEQAFETVEIAAGAAIDPRTGEVLALASKPAFDPNAFATGIQPQEWRSLIFNAQKPLLDRAIQSSYPPGSTFKVVTAAAGLEYGKISETTKMPRSCVGGFSYGRGYFGCWKKEGHGRMNVHEAIMQSCDVFFYQLGLQLGVETLCHFAKQCGLGRKTGIDLPQERAGLIPSPEWYDRAYGEQGWTEGVIISVAIGQGEVLASPLQMANLTAGIANDGIYYTPHLLKRVSSLPDTSKPLPMPTIQTHRLPYSASTLRIIQNAMRDVVNSDRGTARRARIKGIEVCGKTGTSQNPHGEDHAWFIAYAPYENPEIALAIVVENGGSGGRVAAPLAQKVLQAYFEADHHQTLP
ncbi:MAG: penicillin-binding protein 2 [Gemmatimonadetes bacterium]|nr:MAG: penicillin-binding protein 2 [Gemmatimonadota bacterium]